MFNLMRHSNQAQQHRTLVFFLCIAQEEGSADLRGGLCGGSSLRLQSLEGGSCCSTFHTLVTGLYALTLGPEEDLPGLMGLRQSVLGMALPMFMIHIYLGHPWLPTVMGQN